MKNQIPVNSCETGNAHCSSCHPCMKKMMIVIPLIAILVGGYFAYSYFYQTEPKAHAVVNTNPQAIDNSVVSAYSEENFNHFFGKQKFALFFSASWCPKCVATKNAIQQTPEKFSNVKLLDVNYDTETLLKQQYGITLQHSFVFFNADGSVAGTSKMPSDEEMIAFFTKNTLPSQKEKKEEVSSDNVQRNAQYQDYSESTYSELLGEKPLALFFHASWCPTCRSEEKLIQENLSSFPKDFTILKADYDTETELKKKYGITMQSIVVVIDETGKEIGRVGDFSSIERLTDLFSKQ